MVSFYHYLFFIKMHVVNANSLDPDQMPRSVASAESTPFANVPYMGC